LSHNNFGTKKKEEIGLGFIQVGPKNDPIGADPLMYTSSLKVSTGANLLEMEVVTQSILGNLEFPFYVLHGGEDPVASVQGSKELYEKSKTLENFKRIKIYPYAKHNLVREAKSVLCKDIIDWIDFILNQPKT